MGKTLSRRLCKVELSFKTGGYEQAFVCDDEELVISTQHTKYEAKSNFFLFEQSFFFSESAPRSRTALQYGQTFNLVLTCACYPVPFAVRLGVLPPLIPGTGTSWRNARSYARRRLRCPMERGRKLP